MTGTMRWLISPYVPNNRDDWVDTLTTDSDSGQWRKVLCRDPGVIPADPPRNWLPDVAG
jgi:hypothetical protein